MRALAFSQNSQTLLSGSDDLCINLTDVETLQRKMTVTGHSDWVTSIAVNNNTKAIVSGSLDGHIKVWDLNSGKSIKTMN